MAHKNISPEDAFNNIKPSLLQYTDLADQTQDSPQKIFDDILTIEERYKESRIINQGGMKKILKTTDSLTNRPVAKAILIDFEDSTKTESFLREARLTAALEHPNIIPVYDIGIDESEGPFFIMKLVGGRNLSSILKSMASSETDTNYSLRELMIIFLKVCDAVAYAHSKGIVHLDLKPENIQIGDYGEVLVCDWGLAKVLDQPEDIINFEIDLDPCLYNDVTLDGFIKGTPGYMAPEQIDTQLGSKNQKTDIYALGGILYSLLCLKVPFESETLEGVIKETLVGDLLLPSERDQNKFIPPSLEAVAMKALEIKQEWRYETVSDLKQEINKWMGGFATKAEEASFATSLWLLSKRHKTVSILLLIIFFSSIFAFYKIKQNENKALENEKIALSNENKAKEALALYLKEKELTGEISDHAIKQLKVINDYYLEKSDFNKAIQFIDGTIEFQPENEFLNTLKGETHFYRQEYKDAFTFLQKAGQYKDSEPYKTMLELAPKYAELIEDREFLSAADLVDLVLSFNETDRLPIFNYEAGKFSSGEKYKLLINNPLNLPLLKNHMEFCRLLFIRDHTKKLTLHFKYSFEDDGINLNFSNSKNLNHLKYITHLPMKSLNVENTNFWRQWIFNHFYLKSINIRNTNIQKMSYNNMINSGLKEITLTQDQYDQSDIRAAVKKRIQFIVD